MKTKKDSLWPEQREALLFSYAVAFADFGLKYPTFRAISGTPMRWGMPHTMAAVKIHVATRESPCDLRKTKTEPKKWEQVARTRPKYDQSIFSKCRLYQPFFSQQCCQEVV